MKINSLLSSLTLHIIASCDEPLAGLTHDHFPFRESQPLLEVESRVCASAKMRTTAYAMLAIAFGLAAVTVGATGQTTSANAGLSDG
jgi:hypothetical protein